MFRIDILTIFPEVITPYVNASILGRAQKKKLIEIYAHNLRRWTHDKHKSVDDKPFGGGPGMVMKVEPFHEALIALTLCKKDGKRPATAKRTRIILTSAKGKTFTQADAKRLAKYDRLVFLCGRYEGIDERVAEHLADEELSIGNYVLTGGELPALVMTDAIVRLRPGVLGKQESLSMESHTALRVLEYPQYTRPEVYFLKRETRNVKRQTNNFSGFKLQDSRFRKGWRVPKILLSGNHKKISAWRSGKTLS